MAQEPIHQTAARLGNRTLYEQIQEDAITLIESIGVQVSAAAAKKIGDQMAPGEAGSIIYAPVLDRFYISRQVIETCLDRVRQGYDYWPRGFGTGGMAAYVADANGSRLAELDDVRRLARIFARSDELTSLQSSFNPGSKVRSRDLQKRGEIDCACIDLMIECADGKLVTPTIRTEQGIRHLASYHERGYRTGAALSIISTNMTISEEMLDQFLLTVKSGIPFLVNSMPISGLTGPYSMSSLVTLAQAQALFGMVLGQLLQPGVRCINAAMPTIADLSKKDMPLMFGSRANTLVNILLAELNDHLGLPSIQSACCHSRDTIDQAAEQEAAATFALVNVCRYHSLRHLFGFSAQLNDFSIDGMERQIELYRRVSREPEPVPLPEPVEYDVEGLEAVIGGLDRGDFRNLDHTLKHVGRSFVWRNPTERPNEQIEPLAPAAGKGSAI